MSQASGDNLNELVRGKLLRKSGNESQKRTNKSRQQNSTNIGTNAKQQMYERNRREKAKKQNKKPHTH